MPKFFERTPFPTGGGTKGNQEVIKINHVRRLSDEEIKERGICPENAKERIVNVRESNQKRYENVDKFRAEKSYVELRSGDGKCENKPAENQEFFTRREKVIREIGKLDKNWEEKLLMIFVKIEEREMKEAKDAEKWIDHEKEKQLDLEFQKVARELELEAKNHKDSEKEKEFLRWLGQKGDDYESGEDQNVRGNLRCWEKDLEDEDYFDKVLILELLAERKSRLGIDFSLMRLRKDEDFVLVFQSEINMILTSDKQYTLEKIVGILKNEDLNEREFFRLITTASDVFGEMEVRDKINALILEANAIENADVRKKLEYASSFITPNSDKEAILNLQKFYQTKIKFEDYKINAEMNGKEVALLKSLIGKDEKALEMGCGTGRLITELSKDGYDLTGYDYTERHIKITKENLEKNNLPVKVFQGDWHHNALKDGSVDAVYSLGRNILHDYSVIDQAELFREAARILKPDGQFIFDIPNREKGGYREMVEGYVAEMKKRGIENFRYGAIYDSPDGENFATRYCYSQEDIKLLAQLSGFEIMEVKKEKLETEKDDENFYFVLKKKVTN